MLARVRLSNENTDMDVGAVFVKGMQRLRKQQALTQAKLAERAGISVQMTAALEQREKAPSIETINKVCAALGVRPSELFSAGETQTSLDDTAERIAGLLRGLSRVEQNRIVDIVGRITALTRGSVRKRK